MKKQYIKPKTIARPMLGVGILSGSTYTIDGANAESRRFSESSHWDEEEEEENTGGWFQ